MGYYYYGFTETQLAIWCSLFDLAYPYEDSNNNSKVADNYIQLLHIGHLKLVRLTICRTKSCLSLQFLQEFGEEYVPII